MTSSPHALEPHRATARLDIWTVNVTEPVFVGCLSSREPVPAICRPAALLGAHLCCHQQPGMSETRSFRWDGEQMSSHAGAETAEAGESREEVIDPLVSSGRGGCGVGGVGNYERYDGRWRSPAPALLPKTNQPAASTAPQLPKVAPRVHSSPKTPGLQTILLRKDFFVCINCIIMITIQYFSLRICTWSDP